MKAGFDTKTNHNRVNKMMELIDHLETSARSNGADAEDWQELVGRVHERLGRLTGAFAGAPASAGQNEQPGAELTILTAGQAVEPEKTIPAAREDALWWICKEAAPAANARELTSAISALSMHLEDRFHDGTLEQERRATSA